MLLFQTHRVILSFLTLAITICLVLAQQSGQDKSASTASAKPMPITALTGRSDWPMLGRTPDSGRVNDWPEQGVCSTPCIDDNRLYYMSNRCELICVNVEGMASEPRILWRLDVIKELGVFPHNMAASSPLVMGDSVFVVTGNGHDQSHVNIPAPNAPSFLAVNKLTGKVVWHDNSPG